VYTRSPIPHRLWALPRRQPARAARIRVRAVALFPLSLPEVSSVLAQTPDPARLHHLDAAGADQSAEWSASTKQGVDMGKSRQWGPRYLVHQGEEGQACGGPTLPFWAR
jgi:hypothetical protein